MTRDEMKLHLDGLCLGDEPLGLDLQPIVVRYMRELMAQGRITRFTVCWMPNVECGLRTGRSHTGSVSVTWDGGSIVYLYEPKLAVIADVMDS